jgi:hypothetical protein
MVWENVYHASLFPTCCPSSTSSVTKDCQALENQTVIPVQGTNPLWIMQTVFRHHYTPHQDIIVDESLANGRNETSLMYLPNKHHHWGIKLWMLCNSVSTKLLPEKECIADLVPFLHVFFCKDKS